MKSFRSLEKHVCSLKLAKRLCELGIRQDTYFHWLYDEKNNSWDVCWTDYFDDEERHYPAFTVQDLIDVFSQDLIDIFPDLINYKIIYQENMANVFAEIIIAIIEQTNTDKTMDEDVQ